MAKRIFSVNRRERSNAGQPSLTVRKAPADNPGDDSYEKETPRKPALGGVGLALLLGALAAAGVAVLRR